MGSGFWGSHKTQMIQAIAASFMLLTRITALKAIILG
uniref:Uncharacterized protein n=1 Tax=Rhodnius prolixus TaxID=13249 RepID=T1HG85_RHOPR